MKTVIHDARTELPNASLDECGFELCKFAAEGLNTDDFYTLNSNADLKEKLYNQVECYLEKHLQAECVCAMHHQVRNETRLSKPSDHVGGYAHQVPHTDSSALSGDETFLAISKANAKMAEAVERCNGKTNNKKAIRYQYLNLWKNIDTEPIENHHLAVLDERSVVKPDDYIEKDVFMGHGIHIVQYAINARHHHLHDWYHYPRMTNNEALLFKQSDSDHTKKSRSCFHVAVPDPKAAVNHRPRQSIEIRCVALFSSADPDAVDTLPTEELISSELQNKNMGLPNELFSAEGATAVTDADIPKFVNALTDALNNIAHWPMGGKAWAEGLFKLADGQDGNEEAMDNAFESGLAQLAGALSQDSTGHFGLKHQAAQFQAKVKAGCTTDEKFRAAVREKVAGKPWAKVAQQYRQSYVKNRDTMGRLLSERGCHPSATGSS